MKTTEISTILSEGLMADKEWNKTKYWTAFVDSLRSGVNLFNFKTKTGELVLGSILNPTQVAKAVEHIYSSNFKEATRKDLLKNFVIQVSTVDDEDNPIPGTVFPAKITQIFKDERVTGSLKPNMGDVAEAILGCAVTAKFEKRDAEITVEDAMNVGRRIADANGEITGQAGKDKLYFKVSIPFISKKAFYSYIGKDSLGKTLQDYNVPPATIEKFVSYFKSAVEYANKSTRVAAAIQKAEEDRRKNQVEVISDGGEKANQSITKVDLKVLVDGTSWNLLSIKAGAVQQFGQVAGANFEHLAEFFITTTGLKLSDTVRKKFAEVAKGARGEEALATKMKNYAVGFKAAYGEIFKQLNTLSKNDPATLVKRVYTGMVFHLTRKEPGVEMVILEPNAKKAFAELSFGKEFKQALNQLQLFVEEAHTDTDYYINVYGIPKTETARKVFKGKEKLIILRSRIEDKKNFRNVIGMGPLLKELADVERVIAKQKTAPVTPVKTAPKLPVRKQPVAKPTAQVQQPELEPELAQPVQTAPRARRSVAQTPVRQRR